MSQRSHRQRKARNSEAPGTAEKSFAVICDRPETPLSLASARLLQAAKEPLPPGRDIIAAQNLHHGLPALAFLLEASQGAGLYCWTGHLGDGVSVDTDREHAGANSPAESTNPAVC